MNDTKAIVAKNITELRIGNNLTQMELAEKLNYSDKTISKWERRGIVARYHCAGRARRSVRRNVGLFGTI